MPRHPRDSIPAEQVQPAMEALLLTLARDEPEALIRATQAVEGAGCRGGAVHPAALLANEYLALAGTAQTTDTADRRLYRFSYSGYLLFAVSAGSRRAANRIARQQIAALLATEAPVGAIAGAYPGHEALVDLAFWLAEDAEGGLLELVSVDE